MKLEPKDAMAHANLGVAYVRLKRVDDGIRELEEAVSLKADDYEALVSLGAAYRQKATTSRRSRTWRRRRTRSR